MGLYTDFPYAEPVYHTATTNRFTKRRIRQITWDKVRKVLWCIDTTGNLVGLTRDRSLGVNAWHEHELGNYDSSTARTFDASWGMEPDDPIYLCNDGAVESVVAVENTDDDSVDVWLSSVRQHGTAGVNTLRWSSHLERIVGDAIGFSSVFDLYQAAYVFTDCTHYKRLEAGDSLTYSGGTESSLARLKFETFTPVAYNESHGVWQLTDVGDGDASTITITDTLPDQDTERYFIRTGFNFTSTIEPLRPEAGSQIGTAQGAMKRITQAVIRFYRTIGATVGPDSTNTETINFRDADDNMSDSAELYTGDKLVKLHGDYNRNGYLYIAQTQPLPFAVAGIIVEGQTYD